MCGIIGIISDKPVATMILEGLKRLEYRGYDSAGIATVTGSGGNSRQIERRRAEGKLQNLAARVEASSFEGTIGIGHTRWATHGGPTETNAHPHTSADVAIVHNGIIENFDELRSMLIEKGHKFESETDTEVVVHLIQDHLQNVGDPVEAARLALKQLEGAFGLGILFREYDDLIIGARRGSPLAIGFGPQKTDGSLQEMFLGSDAFSLSSWTNRICYLEEGDWVVLRPGEASIRDENDNLVNREIHTSRVGGEMIGKGEYRHFMEKEIFEQPGVIGETLSAHINSVTKSVHFDGLDLDFNGLKRLTIIACGTSFYAGQVAKYWLEQIARLPVEIDIASEYRYREAPIGDGEAALFISQSGETSDTLAALRYCKQQGAKIISIVNVPESTIARESHYCIQTLAGPEIGVASTKAMTTQMAVLAMLAVHAGAARGHLSPDDEAKMLSSLIELPARASELLKNTSAYESMGHRIAESRDVLFLGRGSLYPIAMEGALKLKEISYIHAEGYAAGEMKHGPIALIDEQVPVIVAAPSGGLFEKTFSNCEEAAARGGQLIMLTDKASASRVAEKASHVLIVPDVDNFAAPILYTIPFQLIAYHTAVAKGTDVDQPRNLAKSVTVE